MRIVLRSVTWGQKLEISSKGTFWMPLIHTSNKRYFNLELKVLNVLKWGLNLFKKHCNYSSFCMVLLFRCYVGVLLVFQRVLLFRRCSVFRRPWFCSKPSDMAFSKFLPKVCSLHLHGRLSIISLNQNFTCLLQDSTKL